MSDTFQTTTISFRFDTERMPQLSALMEMCAFSGKPELLNGALSLLTWAVGHIQKGKVIGALDERANQFIEVQYPFLSAVVKDQTP